MTESSGSDETPATTRQAIRDGIDDAYAKASKTAQIAVERTKDGLEQVKGRVSDAYASSREKAQSAGKSAADGLESNPLAALLGGLAIGAAIGALLPRTEREAETLGPIGERVRAAASEAIEAAKDAGRDKLDELGLSKDHARETLKSLIGDVVAAAGSAGTSAFESAKNKPGA